MPHVSGPVVPSPEVAAALAEGRAALAELEPELGHLERGQVLGVAAELDVHAAARHVGGDRDRAGGTGLGDHLALSGGVLGLGVEHAVLDAALGQLL